MRVRDIRTAFSLNTSGWRKTTVANSMSSKPIATNTRSRMRKDAIEKARLLPVGHPEVVILSEKSAQLYEPSGREVCISITGPNKPLPPLSGRFHAVLRLAFSDITEPVDDSDYVLFNEGHATEILGFARRWREVDRVVIHCHAGLSRSPGIAMGLSELFAWGSTTDLQQQHPMANAWVRKELVRVGRGAITPQG